MVEALHRSHPLQMRRAQLSELSALIDGVEIELGTLGAAVDVRIDPQGPGAQAVGRVLGSSLPLSPNTWTYKNGGQLIWLGPDEWLVTCTELPAEQLHDALEWVVDAFDGAAVDVSAQRATLFVRGGRARELLSFGCALDLRPEAFGPGSCAQTLVGQAGVLMLALPDGGIQLLVRPSLAVYLADFLLDVAVEFRP